MMKEEREKLYRELKSSGQTVAAFSRERGIPVHRMYELTKRRRKEEKRAGSFVRVGGGASVVVIVSEGVRIESPIESLGEVLTIVGASR